MYYNTYCVKSVLIKINNTHGDLNQLFIIELLQI